MPEEPKRVSNSELSDWLKEVDTGAEEDDKQAKEGHEQQRRPRGPDAASEVGQEPPPTPRP